MMIRTAFIFAAASLMTHAAVRSGKAEADWISTSTTYVSGKPIQTALRLVLDEHWHTYWVNPGEGGMEISVKWELPAGWVAADPEYPVPMRFMTGDLPGFGYEGTVLFPVNFTVPTDFNGPASLKGKISWLTCNADSCVPGSAELELVLTQGAPSPTPEAGLIAVALEKIPRPAAGAALAVVEAEKTLKLTISGTGIEMEGSEIFPATPQAVDAGAPFKFQKSGATWVAEVTKNEYASSPVKELTLVIARKNATDPVSLTWKSPTVKNP